MAEDPGAPALSPFQEQILQFLKKAGRATALEVAHGVDLKTRKQVNPDLYKMEKAGVIASVDTKNPPVWMLPHAQCRTVATIGAVGATAPPPSSHIPVHCSQSLATSMYTLTISPNCSHKAKKLATALQCGGRGEGGASEAPNVPSSASEFVSSGITVVKDKDVGVLMDYLCQHSHKWEAIGTALHFLPGELKNINCNYREVQHCLKEVLSQWAQWPTTAHSQAPTMEMLRDALRSDQVGLGAVANQLYDTRNSLPSQLD